MVNNEPILNLAEARNVEEKLKPMVLFLEDFSAAIKFQSYHLETQANLSKTVQAEIGKIKQERDDMKASLAKAKEEYQNETTSNQRARFAQKTLDDNQKKETQTEINTLLERKSKLEKSHAARIESTKREFENFIAEKKAALALEDGALQKAKDEREEYKRKAASW